MGKLRGVFAGMEKEKGTGDQHKAASWQLLAIYVGNTHFSSCLTLLLFSWRESQKTLWQEIGNVNKTQQPLGKSKFNNFQTQSPHRSGLPKIVGPVLVWGKQFYQLFYQWCCVVRGKTAHKGENLYKEAGWKQCLGGRKERMRYDPGLWHCSVRFWQIYYRYILGIYGYSYCKQRKENQRFWYNEKANVDFNVYQLGEKPSHRTGTWGMKFW